jgi:protocatechuate 3,4-dioxygenase beta subunit
LISKKLGRKSFAAPSNLTLKLLKGEKPMNKSIENRREFLRRASLAAVAFPFLLNCQNDSLAQKSSGDVLSRIKKNANTSPAVNWCGAIDAPENVSWKSVLQPKSVKDQPMIISGTVYKADGKTPARDILIYFYHTDTEGYYNRKRPGEPLHGHFRGWMLTDAKGRYEFSSIRPAPYPERKFAAHVHMTLTGVNFKEDSVDSILFEGDRLISSQEREAAGKKGGFNPIVKLEKDANGIWRATRDIQLWKA